MNPFSSCKYIPGTDPTAPGSVFDLYADPLPLSVHTRGNLSEEFFFQSILHPGFLSIFVICKQHVPIMKQNRRIILVYALLLSLLLPAYACSKETSSKIDRKAVVERHKVITTANNPQSPAQVGNGNFAFGVDITGLQTFTPFNTMAQWSWHSFPLPEGADPDKFEGVLHDTHGRMVPYDMPDPGQQALSSYLEANPHRFNLGRIGLLLQKADGTEAVLSDLKNTRQEIDLWKGIIYSTFMLDGEEVSVTTSCHPASDILGISVRSPLVKQGKIRIFLDFPYPDLNQMDAYVGSYTETGRHTSAFSEQAKDKACIKRQMDGTRYYTALQWDSPAGLTRETPSSHRFLLTPEGSDRIELSCGFSQDAPGETLPSPAAIHKESAKAWETYWLSGAAIDLSGSTDPRWKELERRTVLSQYLMKVNEAGDLPPQESGLVNNGWYGRFHFEMIWWHGVHYALWNRPALADRYLDIYQRYLPTSEARAARQGYAGARWPKCTADTDREWPHIIHATLIWQQPHPIYFAELDYRENPDTKTLEKWKDVVFATADFMADFAHYDAEKDRYVLGPPVYIVSENTDPFRTINPAFELAYWRYGLETAVAWSKRLSLTPSPAWEKVLEKLSPLPVENGVYVTHEGINDMWKNYAFEHPALIGTYGMLPGNGVDGKVFKQTLDKVMASWDFDRTWGWDFPMLAMAAARTGNADAAVGFLLHPSHAFRFDEHGLATGGPFPYFPSNGAFLTAIAMMAGGWDGSEGDAPGFPQNGKWVVKTENLRRMP